MVKGFYLNEKEKEQITEFHKDVQSCWETNEDFFKSLGDDGKGIRSSQVCCLLYVMVKNNSEILKTFELC